MGLYKRKDSPRFWWMNYSVRGKQMVRSTGMESREQAQAVLDEYRRTHQLPYRARAIHKPSAPHQVGRNPGVYCLFSEATQLIKIGCSENMPQRISSLNSGSPEEWRVLVMFPCDNYTLIEASLHGAFKERRVRGEWFRITRDELATRLRFHGWDGVLQ